MKENLLLIGCLIYVAAVCYFVINKLDHYIDHQKNDYADKNSTSNNN